MNIECNNLVNFRSFCKIMLLQQETNSTNKNKS